MTILLVRADSPEVEIDIHIDGKPVASKHWQAGRELSGQIHQVIDDLLSQSGKKLTDLTGIVVYEGPGSYTGLRISISVVNALGYSLNIPAVATTGPDWKPSGSAKLEITDTFVPVVPVYGGQVYTTTPRK